MAIGNSKRDPLFWLVTGVTTFVWAASAIDALVTGQFRVFEIASGPYLLIVGFVTGVKIVRGGDK